MKKIGFIAMFVLTMTLLAGCGRKTFTCDLCFDTVTERPHTEKILGQEIEICSECYKELKELRDLF